ncbi:MAG: threonylcarbamoyl-AMP synthase [Desulfobulbus propionicus]|nr:MAG: threonylcarbamoyl-AMP synthase [Desulfobulbus propionicus]
MTTTIKKIDSSSIDLAVSILRAGGIIAYPTETFYGLGVDPFNRAALKRLYAVKQRERSQPILLLVSGMAQCASLLAEPVAETFTRLAKCYWPGPLTLVHKARPDIPNELTGQTGSVGVRQSPHPSAAEILRRFQRPVTGTSANISGSEGAARAKQVVQMFPQELDLILDGGETPGKTGSTLVQCSNNSIQCIREGSISYQAVCDTLTLQHT